MNETQRMSKANEEDNGDAMMVLRQKVRKNISLLTRNASRYSKSARKTTLLAQLKSARSTKSDAVWS
jgi:hypothetical protein